MTDKVKKQIILNLPYLIFVYLFDKLCQGIRLAPLPFCRSRHRKKFSVIISCASRSA